MSVSKRIQALASLVAFDSVVADIGSDHGLLLQELYQRGYLLNSYGSENKKGPFLRLEQSLKAYPKAHVYLEDGLNHLPESVKTIVIAGMGGELILEILKRGVKELSRLDYVILAPHAQEREIRRFMLEHGFMIDEEILVHETHFYEIMRFKKGTQLLSEKEYYFGPVLLKKQRDLLKTKYQKIIENDRYLIENKPLSLKRKQDLLQEIKECESLWTPSE